MRSHPQEVTGMQRAPELAEALVRIYDAVSRGDAAAVERAVSRQDGLVFIGTDPGEWFEDVVSIRDMLRAQAGAGVTVVPGDIRAYREGSVGWVADRGTFRLADGGEVPFRMTAVFHQEDGEWRIVQEHASIAVSNAEVLGQEL